VGMLHFIWIVFLVWLMTKGIDWAFEPVKPPKKKKHDAQFEDPSSGWEACR